LRKCIAFEDDWCEKRECGKYPGLEKEQCAILEMLNNFSALNIKGGIIRLDNRIVALTIGEKFLKDTMVIHIEKANADIPDFIRLLTRNF